jgi:uncharacterized protein
VASHGSVYSFRNTDKASLLAARVVLAGTSRDRRTGLLGKREMEDLTGMWILPCEAIHTFFMKMAIDSVFLDKQLRVTKVKANLCPFRIAVSLRAHSVLELPPGTVLRSRTEVGDRLECST